MIDFLSRWSRLKRDHVVEPTQPRAIAPPTTATAGQPAEVALAPCAPPPLPALDELTADADFTAFMRPEVPSALRNAALRRLWTSDPAIRDFVGPARDYAYDWNTPGGVPGAGPLDPSTNVSALVSSLFGPGREAAGPGSKANELVPRPSVEVASATDESLEVADPQRS